MSNHDPEYITREEFAEFRLWLEEKFKALTWRGLLALGVSVGLLRFDLPDPVTAAAVIGAIAASIGKAVTVIVGGRSL